ncbi:MAG: SWIM zinc finger family protein [Anaerolineales bacterium]|nr:SWIM zinc finger family protein [Anaerolineales bacterium]
MTTLTESTIRSFASEQSFERGHEYYHSGSIYNTVRQGNTLLADCEGTYTYHLRIELDEGGIQSTSCTCPYDFGGYCKHLVALLLTYIHKPGEFTERKPISALLENVDKATLVTVLAKLTDRNPELYNWLETSLPVASVTFEQAESQTRPVSQVSEPAWRKRIKNVLRPGRGYYDDYESSYSASNDLDEITNSASEILTAGDAQGAITILLALLEELYDAYEMFDDSDGDLGDSANYAGEILAEAILSADLDEKERKSLECNLAPIAKDLSDYAIENGVEIAQLALEYGWETHPEYVNDFTADLDKAKLNVLERQGRTDEFLSLCQQTGQHLRYTQKLMQLGRIEEAIHVAYQISEPNHILEIAKTLRESNRLSDAISLAEHGITLGGQKYHLAAWLAPLEESQRRLEPALQAHLATFSEAPSLETYKHIQRLSGEHWTELQPEQMKILLQSGRLDAIASVYLHEQQWDEAIVIAEKNTHDYSLREKVADAVIAYRPDWVIRISIQEAEKLIEPTQSRYYPHAARWLAKAKQAYIQSSRAAEWQAYFNKLKITYARRPSLQKELARL